MRLRSLLAGLCLALPAVAALATAQAAEPKSTMIRRSSDHVGAYNFVVEIDGIDAGQFLSVEGLSVEQEVIEYQDGDDLILRKRPGRAKYGDITLKKGFVADSVLSDWIEAAAQGKVARKTVSIALLDQHGDEVKRWDLFECWPKSWKISSPDGEGNDVLTEEMVLVIEWFQEA